MNLGFRQDLNNYLWEYRLGYQKNLNNRWWLMVNENFRSSLLKLSAGAQKSKDDHLLDFSLGYRLAPQWSAVLKTNSLTFDDQQSLFRNDVNALAGIGQVNFKPTPLLHATLDLGSKWERRFQQNDYSLSYGAGFYADRFEYHGYQQSALVKLENDDFSVRRNRALSMHYRVQRQFYDNSADSLYIFLDRRRRDYFTSATGAIESLKEYSRGLDNTLIYGISPGLEVHFNTLVVYKTIDIGQFTRDRVIRQRKRNDQRLESDLKFQIERQRLNFNFRLAFGTQKQLYDIAAPILSSPFTQRAVFITPDNESKNLLLSTRTALQLGSRDLLELFFSSSLYQYDTPDTNNYDDRDELRVTSRCRWRHTFSPQLLFELLTSVNLFHLVYIFGETSANNNWNRVLLLRPTVKWTLAERFQISQSFEVLANYVAYDYETAGQTLRSYVFRKFAIDDSLSWQLSRKSNLSLSYRLHLEENGRLFWSDWLEQLLVTRQKHWLRTAWEYRWQRNFTLSSGIAFYRRKEWNHKTSATGVMYKEIFNDFTSFGPVLHFNYQVSDRVQVEFSGMRQKVMPQEQKPYYINNLDLQLDWFW